MPATFVALGVKQSPRKGGVEPAALKGLPSAAAQKSADRLNHEDLFFCWTRYMVVDIIPTFGCRRMVRGKEEGPEEPIGRGTNGMDGAEIRTLRKERGQTQEEFAHEVGVTFATVNRWENGKSKPSRLALKILDALKHQTETSAKKPATKKAAPKTVKHTSRKR